MLNIDYVATGERLDGANAPDSRPDILNRPIKNLLTGIENGDILVQSNKLIFDASDYSIDTNVQDEDFVYIDGNVVKKAKYNNKLGVITLSNKFITLEGLFTFTTRTSLISGTRYFIDKTLDGNIVPENSPSASTGYVGTATSNDSIAINLGYTPISEEDLTYISLVAQDLSNNWLYVTDLGKVTDPIGSGTLGVSHIKNVSENMNAVQITSQNIDYIKNVPDYIIEIQNSVSLAENWANKYAEGVPDINNIVADGEFSAKYYAMKAKDFAKNTIWNGTTAPINSIGINGDFYIDNVNYIIYGPKNNTWGVGTKIKGTGIQNVSTEKVGLTTTITISGDFDNSPATFDINDGQNILPYIAIGSAINNTSVYGETDIVIGSNNELGTDYSGTIILGGNTRTNIGLSSISIGSENVSASGDLSIAIGNNSNSIGNNGIALGSSSFTESDSSIAIGENANSRNSTNIIVGSNSDCSTNQSVIFGSLSSLNAPYCTLIGTNNNLNDDTFLGSTALGHSSAQSISGEYQVQLGNSLTTTYVYGTVQNRSDYRDKAEIEISDLGLEFINKLEPVKYKWDLREDYYEDVTEEKFDEILQKNIKITKRIYKEKDGSKIRKRFHYGLVAQQVKTTLDSLGIDFGGYQDHSIGGGVERLTLGYDEFISPLIKAIQELSKKVESLEKQINS